MENDSVKANPKIRNGKNSNHKIGYRKRAMMAIGQQITQSIHHNTSPIKNLIALNLLDLVFQGVYQKEKSPFGALKRLSAIYIS